MEEALNFGLACTNGKSWIAMRLQFRDRPWDLYIAVGYTVVMSAILLGLGTANLLAIVLVLLAPGYVLVAALFPGGTEIDWMERIALGFGLSVAIVPLLGLLLNFTPWGIRYIPVVVTITLFTTGVGCAAYWRRMHLQAERRLSLTLDFSTPSWKDYTTLEKGFTIALAASTIVAVGTLAYVAMMPRPGDRFTEFYLLGPSGNATGYPRNLTVNETGSVIIGIANHEAATVNYTIRVDLVGVRIAFNATSGFNETVEVNRTTLSWKNATVADGANWTRPHTFRINYTGLWKVEFLLFKDGDFSSAYRELHLYVRVT